MPTGMKIAICAAVVDCAASASFAKDPMRADENCANVARHAFGQAEIVRNPARQPMSGAEWWQNHGIADEMGYAYP